MTKTTHPFAVPAKVSEPFKRVRRYWERLKRGDNNIPFWDDLNLSSLPEVSDQLMLVDAFENPSRFRLNRLGNMIQEQYGVNVTGKFVDEIDIKPPFDFFTAQATATVEARAPTFWNRGSPVGNGHSYARLLLPLWGNGRIEMLLGLIADTQNADASKGY
jgi:hypothetical protein